MQDKSTTQQEYQSVKQDLWAESQVDVHTRVTESKREEAKHWDVVK